MRYSKLILEQWREGRKHGFPQCCRARFIVDCIRPSLSDTLLPKGLASRLKRLTHPRHAVADGMVPCEYHLAAYLLTGDRTKWRKPLPPTMCCTRRNDLVEAGYVALSKETIPPDEGEGAEFSVWMFGLTKDDQINISNCPFCGAALD